MVKYFFEQLSEYYRQENDLSNIAVAMCNSSNEFRKKFVQFFFCNIDVDKIASISREVPDQNNLGSRVDIYITMSDENAPYIIEVKIGDRNHHFGQYEEAYVIGKERFGYITNYECTEGKELGYDVKTWEELHDYLIKSGSSDELINGFTAYLKNVCGIIKYENPMNIKGLDSIPCYVDTVRKIIAKKRDWVRTRKNRPYFVETSYHQGFYINYDDKNDDVYALFGLWFFERPIISIIINSTPWLSEKILQEDVTFHENSTFYHYSGQYCAFREDDVWFELNDKKLQEFIDASSYEEQIEVLEGFFEEVLRCIQKVIRSL